MRSEHGSSDHADVIWLISLKYPWLSDPLSLKHRPIVPGRPFYCALNGRAMFKTKACVCLPKVSIFKLPHNGWPVFTLQWTKVYQSHHKLVCLEGLMAIIKFSHNRFIKVTVRFGKQVIKLLPVPLLLWSSLCNMHVVWNDSPWVINSALMLQTYTEVLLCLLYE